MRYSASSSVFYEVTRKVESTRELGKGGSPLDRGAWIKGKCQRGDYTLFVQGVSFFLS